MTDILMAVYNGEEYLAEQIESILAQSSRDWRLYICDDCSADSSLAIASEYAEKYPEYISVMQNETPSGSACANFMGMLRRSQADYVMFSDQDDVWLPHKLASTMEEMKRLEGRFPDSPLLVHTELEVADRDMNVTSPSFTRFQGLEPRFQSLSRLVCQNNITGCTMLINRRLADIVRDAPTHEMLMHDWWIGMAAAAFGHIGFVEKPLIKYRQHGGNQLGAVNNRSISGIMRIVRERVGTQRRISATYRQAEAFLGFYGDMLSEENRRLLRIYTDIPHHAKPIRAARLIRYGFLKQNFITAAGQLIFC